MKRGQQNPRWQIKWLMSLIVVSNFSIEANGQGRNPIEIELGLNSAGLPERTYRRHGIEKTFPVLSPLFGLWVGLSPDRRLGLNVGVQFYRTGQRYKYDVQYTELTKTSVSASTRENMTFHQFSFPFLATYSFPVGTSKLGVVLGGRISNLTRGYYYYKNEVIRERAVVSHEVWEKSYDPLGNDIQYPAKRVNPQAGLGMTFAWATRWKASLTYFTGSSIQFSDQPPSVWCGTGYIETYGRGDLAVAVRYRVL